MTFVTRWLAPLRRIAHRGQPYTLVHTRWHPLRARLQAHWQALNPRERRQLALAFIVLLGALVWLLGVKPARDNLVYWEQELPRLQSQSTALQELLGEVAIGTEASPMSLTARLHASLNDAGLSGRYQVEAASDALQITFDHPTDATVLMNWLLNVALAPGVRVREVTIQREPDAESPVAESAVRVYATVTVAHQ